MSLVLFTREVTLEVEQLNYRFLNRLYFRSIKIVVFSSAVLLKMTTKYQNQVCS